MSTVMIELPAVIQANLGAGGRDVSRLTLESLAVESYRKTLLSQRQVGEMLGLNFWETEVFLKEHQAYLHYDINDLNQDMEVLGQLEQQK